MKKSSIIILSILTISVLSMIGASYDSHTRWNNLREECVYYYQMDGAVSTCVVAATHCTMDGKNQDVELSVRECTNRDGFSDEGPIECSVFQEGDTIRLTYDAQDPDANIGPAGKLEYTISKPFDENQEWQTERGDAGTYNVTVAVSDGEFTDSTRLCFTIESTNSAPELEVKDVTVTEGETVRIRPACDDADGDALSFAFSGDSDGPTWETGFDDAGEYEVIVTCSDTNGAFDSKTVTVTVEDKNEPPVLSGVSELTVDESETLQLRHTCSDPENGATNIIVSGDMTTRTWETGYDDAGKYEVTVICTDESGLVDSMDVDITVEDRNRPPRITAMVVLG